LPTFGKFGKLHYIVERPLTHIQKKLAHVQTVIAGTKVTH
jgi:hypothetical protein